MLMPHSQFKVSYASSKAFKLVVLHAVTSQGVCPVLVLYSPSDELASPSYVRRFIAALRDRGGSVSSVCFSHSKHVGE